MIELNNDNFNQEIKNSNICILYFSAPWCNPCKAQSKIMENINNKKVIIYKANIEEISSDIYSKYSIMSVPTLLFFKEGDLIETKTGIQNEFQINEILEKLL